MATNTYPNLTQALRDAIADDPRSYVEIARQTGLTRQSLMGFSDGKRSLRLDLADRLMEFYGMSVSRSAPKRRKTKRATVKAGAILPDWLRIPDTPRGAIFDEDRIYRYALWRRWVDRAPLAKMVAFVGLNPSTADETEDDNTIRRCVGFAKSWGFDGLAMLNLFAFAETDSNLMKRASEPVGEFSDAILRHICRRAGLTICCWGADGAFRDRGNEVRRMLTEDGVELKVLRLTKAGYPWHPLYLPSTSKPIHWVE